MVINPGAKCFYAAVAAALIACGASEAEPGVDAARAPVDAAIDAAIDASSVDAGATLADARATPGDTCAEAEDLTGAASAVEGANRWGDTTGLADDLAAPVWCTPNYKQDGADAIYYVEATSGQILHLFMEPEEYDGSVYIVSACDDSLSCVAGSDSGGKGKGELVNYTIPSDGTYYIVVDSYILGQEGPYRLRVSLE